MRAFRLPVHLHIYFLLHVAMCDALDLVKDEDTKAYPVSGHHRASQGIALEISEEGLEGELRVHESPEDTQILSAGVSTNEDIVTKVPKTIPDETSRLPMMRTAKLPTSVAKEAVFEDIQLLWGCQTHLYFTVPIVLAAVLFMVRSANIKRALAAEQFQVSVVGCAAVKLCRQEPNDKNTDLIHAFFEMFGLRQLAYQLKLDRFLQEPHTKDKIEELFTAMCPDQADEISSTEMQLFLTYFWSRVSNEKPAIREQFPLPKGQNIDLSAFHTAIVDTRGGKSLLHRSQFQNLFRLILAWHIAQEASLMKVYNGKIEEDKISKIILGFTIHMTV
jgi:hypothetical protein